MRFLESSFGNFCCRARRILKLNLMEEKMKLVWVPQVWVLHWDTRMLRWFWLEKTEFYIPSPFIIPLMKNSKGWIVSVFMFVFCVLV